MLRLPRKSAPRHTKSIKVLHLPLEMISEDQDTWNIKVARPFHCGFLYRGDFAFIFSVRFGIILARGFSLTAHPLNKFALNWWPTCTLGFRRRPASLPKFFDRGCPQPRLFIPEMIVLGGENLIFECQPVLWTDAHTHTHTLEISHTTDMNIAEYGFGQPITGS